MRRIGDLLRVRLLDSEIEALYDLLDNSLDHIRLFDLTRFLDPGEAMRGTAAGASPGRLELRRSSTVTTVALSPDGSRVACGGMDFYCVVWDAHRDAKLYERRFPKQVGAVALGARDLAVGCFAPGHLDYVEDLDGNGDAAASLDTTWQAGRDVNALAIFERAGELAVAAGVPEGRQEHLGPPAPDLLRSHVFLCHVIAWLTVTLIPSARDPAVRLRPQLQSSRSSAGSTGGTNAPSSVTMNSVWTA